MFDGRFHIRPGQDVIHHNYRHLGPQNMDPLSDHRATVVPVSWFGGRKPEGLLTT
jgi:hypothetical protein